MSHALISHSPDLRRLRDEGFGVHVAEGALIVDPVPFVDSDGRVRKGALISDLDLSGDRTQPPSSHVAYFAGGTPCDRNGNRLAGLIHSDKVELKGGRTTAHMLSSKPKGGYGDYYSKMRTYADAIASHAEALDPSVSARCFPPVRAPEDSPFMYLDTASSRAGVDTSPFDALSVAIIGLGGTGAYVLDLIAKTPVSKIHLYDADKLLQHNAFRAPGAPTLSQIEAGRKKVEHWFEVYSAMHRGIVPHAQDVDDATLDQLNGCDYVFICVDNNDARQLIAQYLDKAGITFIDTGLGVQHTDGKGISGIIRITTATPQQHDHVSVRLPAGPEEEDPDYRTNIQIADLNMLNAALAVIRWKKMIGFYTDQEKEHHSCYVIGGNCIVNEDQARDPLALAT